MDEADYAQQNDELFRQAALAKHFRRGWSTVHSSAVHGLTLNTEPPTVCRDCGEAIGAMRLKAIPAARRCLDCQEKQERRYGDD